MEAYILSDGSSAVRRSLKKIEGKEAEEKKEIIYVYKREKKRIEKMVLKKI